MIDALTPPTPNQSLTTSPYESPSPFTPLAEKSRANEAATAGRQQLQESTFRRSSSEKWEKMVSGKKYFLNHGGGEAWVIWYDAYELVQPELLESMYIEDKDKVRGG